MLKTKTFWEVELVDESAERWRGWLKAHLANPASQLQIVLTPNPEQLVRARRDREFLGLLKQADVLIPDGVGLVRKARLTARLTGVDAVAALLRLTTNPESKHHSKILLIGGSYLKLAQKDDQGHLCLVVPTSEDKQISIYYTQGYQNIKQSTISEGKAINLLISTLKPDIVLAAFGAPEQERFLITHRSQLAEAGVQLALVVGGSFDLILGRVKRAPALWQNCGLEWLWRLIQEPWRAIRQLALLQFMFSNWARENKKNPPRGWDNL